MHIGIKEIKFKSEFLPKGKNESKIILKKKKASLETKIK
jgi:hypothetical protein